MTDPFDDCEPEEIVLFCHDLAEVIAEELRK